VPTEPGRAQAARELVDWGYAAWDSREWLKAGAVLGEIRVQQGSDRSLSVTVSRDFRLTSLKGHAPSVRTRIVYDGPLVAPVAKGAPVGGLEVTVDGGEPYVLPLVAAKAVERAGPIDRLVNGLLGLWS
jgi:D-alanyl-D-alanine carboxypeptidase (penicillin-binding protein 5/6)